jgi:hypothetical protein
MSFLRSASRRGSTFAFFFQKNITIDNRAREFVILSDFAVHITNDHFARPHGIPGTDSHSSHDPGLAPQPSHRTTSASAKQQAL